MGELFSHFGRWPTLWTRCPRDPQGFPKAVAPATATWSPESKVAMRKESKDQREESIEKGRMLNSRGGNPSPPESPAYALERPHPGVFKDLGSPRRPQAQEELTSHSQALCLLSAHSHSQLAPAWMPGKVSVCPSWTPRGCLSVQQPPCKDSHIHCQLVLFTLRAHSFTKPGQAWDRKQQPGPAAHSPTELQLWGTLCNQGPGAAPTPADPLGMDVTALLLWLLQKMNCTNVHTV